MARHDKNTYVACRPGLQTQLRNTFGDSMHIEVANDIDSPLGYEFRQKDLGALGILDDLEEEVRRETLQEADPKNAHTVLVPLTYNGGIEAIGFDEIGYVVVRFQNKDSVSKVAGIIRKVKPVPDDDGECDYALTLGAVRDALQDEEINVLSASIAEGLVFLNY